MRQRGALLLEAILALGVAASLVGLSAAFIAQEKEKQEEIMIASEQGVILAAARNFVQQNYNAIRLDLFKEAETGGSAILAYPMQKLADEGYLPASFSGDGVLGHMYGQQYALIARAVDRADTGTPQVTLSHGDLDPMSTGGIDGVLVDSDPANGEMEIEALLVTYGGDPVRLGDGGDIIGRLDSTFGGYVSEAGTARGPYANFVMDITSFAALAEYPDPGHFAGLVSLSSFGVLGSDAASDGVPDPLRRCDGVNIASQEYADCLASNEIYADIVLNHHDTNGDGIADRFPALRGVTMLDCADSGNTGVQNEFLIDCATTRMTGNLAVAGPDADIGALGIRADRVTFGGDDVLVRQTVGAADENIVQPDRVVIDQVNGGQDLSETIVDTRVVRAGQTVAKPICPATTIDGVTPMEPRIYPSPAAYSDPRGRAIVGVRAFAEDVDATNWRVRLMVFVGQDFCTNDVSSPLSTSIGYHVNGAPDVAGTCTGFDGAGVQNTGDLADGSADVYELDSSFGAVVVQTRCY
ncbi:hypothetical protein OM960_13300 [Defluviimonas sp. CAU 1641]|uniref:Uncharacterized protein n=2 Tax=Defluviimonas salinarum TaxID=2992147 RepID=A0ABT3J4E9_9RHOB|nr:hypothetical protein [Defluviimonas salinarum]